MFDILLRNALFEGKRTDIGIRQGRFTAIEPAGTLQNEVAAQTIEATHLWIRPPFYNTHTHQAMTLLRGKGSQYTLMDWLKLAIWPREAKLTAALVKAGTTAAIIEMIHSGCVAFNDMYFHQPAVIDAAIELGVRAQIGLVIMNQVSEQTKNAITLAMRDTLPPSIHLAYAPHAPYTTTPEELRETARLADHYQLPIHTHVAETLTEVDYVQRLAGCSPIAYLDQCGLLRERTILAHCCHVSEADLEIIAKRGCVVAHCPSSNQKLASGTFPYSQAMAAHVKITVGTDGAASNDALSMISETKAALLLARAHAETPAAILATTMDRQVTTEAAAALGFESAGKIALGYEADLIGVDLRAPCFISGVTVDNFLYAGESSAVKLVLCQGKVLMREGHIPGEEQLLETARQAALQLD